MTAFNVTIKRAVVILGVAVSAPACADEYYLVPRSGPSFGQVQVPQWDGMDSYYRSQRASQQAELMRLEILRRRLEIERGRSGQPTYCRLADGRFVQC